MIRLAATGSSDCGHVRDHNEDTFKIDCERGLFVVADGIGGHAAGEVASSMAVETIVKTLTNGKGRNGGSCNANTLQSAIEQANTSVFENAQRHPERKGMGTTLTFMCRDRYQFYLGHVGDSRAYRLRGNELIQLTRDHTWADLQVRAGVLSQKEAEHAQMRHLLVKSLGTQGEIEPDVIPIDTKPNDRFLLCSDGLSDFVEHNELRKILTSKGPLTEITRRLVAKANAVGGYDNITAIVIDFYDNTWKSKLKSAINKLRR